MRLKGVGLCYALTHQEMEDIRRNRKALYEKFIKLI